MFNTDYEESYHLFEKVNRIRSGSLEWKKEDKETMIKVILLDPSKNYRRALYINKSSKMSEKEALTNLVKSYCIEYGIGY